MRAKSSKQRCPALCLFGQMLVVSSTSTIKHWQATIAPKKTVVNLLTKQMETSEN